MRQEQLTLAMLRDADGRVGKETLCARLDGYETDKIVVLRALGGHLGQFAGASRGAARGIRVDSLMPVETFVHEALSRASSGRLVSERDLGLDDRMHRGVHRDVRQANTRPPVIVPRKGNALLLIQREPLLTVGRVKGIVMLHADGSPPCCETASVGAHVPRFRRTTRSNP